MRPLLTCDHRTAGRQFAAQYKDKPLASLREILLKTVSQNSALTIVMDANVSEEGRTNVLLTFVLLNMTVSLSICYGMGGISFDGVTNLFVTQNGSLTGVSCICLCSTICRCSR